MHEVETGIAIQCQIGQETLRSVVNLSNTESNNEDPVLDSSFHVTDFSGSSEESDTKSELNIDKQVGTALQAYLNIYFVFFDCLQELFFLLRCNDCGGTFQLKKN